MMIITRTLQLTLATVLLLIIVIVLIILIAQVNDKDIAALLRSAIHVTCTSPQNDLAQMANRLGDANGVEEKLIKARGVTIGWQRRFTRADGSEIRLQRVAPTGQAQRFSAEYWTPAAGVMRPIMIAVTDTECAIRLGRRLLYDDTTDAAITLEHLNTTLALTGITEPLNPAVPSGDDNSGVLVALIDAGVNYLLPPITQRLARAGDGTILGYDYWDLDHRPFDANPARSPFFPQRHGTRTASLLLREAPQARLVPYRYPRPDMRRMIDLVRDAAAKGISIVNLSLGSNKADDWKAFAQVAKEYPEILFVVSAGNNGRDIDAQPVYPAALPLNNIITVTSSEIDGQLAPGSNHGQTSVDLLVPAERLIVTGFEGYSMRVSGSSYAAARISAMAARLLAKNPTWRAPELKTAILARAVPPIGNHIPHVAQGFIPDPQTAEQRSPVPRDVELEKIDSRELTATNLYNNHDSKRIFTHELILTLVYFVRTSWDFARLEHTLKHAAELLGQCNVYISRAELHMFRGPEIFLYFTESNAKQLVSRLSFPRPTVYFVRDTLKTDAYQAEAIGRGNSPTRPILTNTVWMTEGISDAGISLAHEMAHVLMDSGEHVDSPQNVMRADTSPENIKFTDTQCETMRRVGMEGELLKPLSSVTHMLQ
jgi:hypothetical protein